jgi:hypothetical protein
MTLEQYRKYAEMRFNQHSTKITKDDLRCIGYVVVEKKCFGSYLLLKRGLLDRHVVIVACSKSVALEFANKVQCRVISADPIFAAHYDEYGYPFCVVYVPHKHEGMLRLSERYDMPALGAKCYLNHEDTWSSDEILLYPPKSKIVTP